MALFAHPGNPRYSGVSQTYCFIRAMCSSKVRAKCAVSRYVDLIRWINSCSLLLARLSLMVLPLSIELRQTIRLSRSTHVLQRMCYLVGDSGENLGENMAGLLAGYFRPK